MAQNNVGRFVWYELLTTDPKAAIAFYTEVIGWKTQPFQNDYTMWVGSQGPLGGAMALSEGMKAPPHWMAHVEVANVDATTRKVTELGGTIHVPPTDIPTVGRFAAIADPTGASLSVFTPANAMTPHDPQKPGEFDWNELLTTDHEAAFRFYSELFGWERIRDFDMGAMGKYLIYGRQKQELGGMFTKPKDMPTPPTFLYYIHVANLDETLQRAQRNGAKVLNGPMPVPGGGRIVQLADPQGAAFALHEAAKPTS